MKINKYKYFKVLQGNYGCGWEDLCQYDLADGSAALKECKRDLKDYRLNEPEYSHRVISRRIQNPQYTQL